MAALAVFIASCGKEEPKESDRLQWVDPAKIKQGPILRDQLTAEQTTRIASVQSVFKEVDSAPLDKWLEDFKRDVNPDREIAIWEIMASVYTNITASKGWSLDQKKELFGVLLVGSGAPPDEAIKHLKLKALSQAEAKEALDAIGKEWNKRSTQATPHTTP